MDNILSSRIDEAIIKKIGLLAQKLNTSKKSVIENAIREYSQKVEEDYKIDILEQKEKNGSNVVTMVTLLPV